ncbi:hypothetical protein ACWIWK_07075 [Helicobacter sp. 23-1048]
MKKLSLIFLVAILGFSACGESKDSKAESSTDSSESQTIDSQDLHESTGESNESSADSSANLDKSAQKDSPKDFIVDCDKCVIQVIATDDEINRFKKEWGEDDFYVIVDDEMWYAYKLDEYLLANGIKTEYISRDKVNYTKVVFSNESVDITRLDSLYNFYLYQKGKKPKELKDTVVFEDEVNAYFGIINPKYPQQESSVDSGESSNESTQDSQDLTQDSSDSSANQKLDSLWQGRYALSREGYIGWIDIMRCEGNLCAFAYESSAGQSVCNLQGKIRLVDSTNARTTSIISDGEDFSRCEVQITKNTQGIIPTRDRAIFDFDCYAMCGDNAEFEWGDTYKKDKK